MTAVVVATAVGTRPVSVVVVRTRLVPVVIAVVVTGVFDEKVVVSGEVIVVSEDVVDTTGGVDEQSTIVLLPQKHE
jgi:hypothetical protein